MLGAMPIVEHSLDPRDSEFVLSEDARCLILAVGETLVYEHFREDARLLQEGKRFGELRWMGDWLPACYADDYTPQLLLRIAKTVKETAHILTEPRPYLACTAEELAAHAILFHARATALEALDLCFSFGVDDAKFAAEDIRLLRSRVFEDLDVLLLFAPTLIDVDSSPLADPARFTNLRLEEWFLPFSGESKELHQEVALPSEPSLPRTLHEDPRYLEILSMYRASSSR